MTIRTAGLAATFLGLALGIAKAADPTGTWLVAGDEAIVRIADCANLRAPPGQPVALSSAAGQPDARSTQGTPADPPTGTLCGMVIWLREPIDPATGKPRVDSLNTDPAKKNQPVLGMQGVFDMRPSREPAQWEGRVYNIDDGKIYDGGIIMKSDNELYVQGCFMMFCRGEMWVRQDPPEPPKPGKPTKPPQARAR
jgi:uncharacterized protein (DUF2147 family)